MITFRYERDPEGHGITCETRIATDADMDEMMTAFYSFLYLVGYAPQTIHEYFPEWWLEDKCLIPETKRDPPDDDPYEEEDDHFLPGKGYKEYEDTCQPGKGWDEEDPLTDVERRIINEDAASPVER